MVDDARSTGCSGPAAPEAADHFGLHGRVDVQVGTLSKAFGVLGGFIAGPRHLIEWLQNRGRPYLFSTSAPAPSSRDAWRRSTCSATSPSGSSGCGRTRDS